MAWVVPLPVRSARFAEVRRVATVGLVVARAPIRRAEFRRATGGVMKILGMASLAAPGGGPVAPSAVVLPAAWLALALPAGFICPLLGQLALVRDEAPVFDSVAGVLRIGGRVLIGTAGKPFAFGGQAAADMWVSINRARLLREVELSAGMSQAALAVFKADKRTKLQARAVAITANAAKQADADKRAAMTAEAGFHLTKWG